MAGYTRQSSFADGDTITAAIFNNEYNAIANTFHNETGHKHDGTAAEGPVIGVVGDAGLVTPLNKVLIDTSNDHIEFWIDDSSSSVQQLYIGNGVIAPVTDSDIDIGTSSLYFKNAYIDAITTTGNVAVGGNLTVTGTSTFNGGTLTLGDSASDNVVFGADVDSHIIPDDDNTYDLGSTTQEWRNLYVDGIAYLDGITLGDTAITATAAELNILDGVTATAAELNLLDGVTSTTAELNILDGVTATATELNLLDGVTSTTAELNILDGVTSTASELNILDGVTSTTAELNILDGVTATAAEINVLDGYTGSVTELNYLDTLHATGVTSTEFDYLDGVTSNIQTQLDAKIEATLTSEQVQDIVGAMVSSNTESGITVTYQDGDGTLDFTIGTLNQDTTGNAATATALETARTIHGVSFDGTANIDLTEVVQDTVGAMVSSNTESGISVTYEDGDGTLDFNVNDPTLTFTGDVTG